MGSRLRRLAERFTADAAVICAEYGSDLEPRWYPVVITLAARGEMSVSALAREIGHSHVSVVQIVRAMTRRGWLEARKSPADARATLVRLSAKARGQLPRVDRQTADVRRAAEQLLEEVGADFWAAIGRCERALERESLVARVARVRAEAAEASAGDGAVRVVDFRPEHAAAFRSLNLEWIRTHFVVEPADERQLEHPRVTIIDAGGHILVALDGTEVVGVCALVPHGEGCLELAKMAVAPRARGRGVGALLGRAAIAWAREHGADRLYLESNTKLAPAIRLYRRLGFVEVKGEPSPYARADIQMALTLRDPPAVKAHRGGAKAKASGLE